MVLRRKLPPLAIRRSSCSSTSGIWKRLSSSLPPRRTCVCPRYCQYRGESVQGLIPVLWALIISHVLTTKGDESLAHQLARCRFGTLVVQLTKDGDETLDIVVDLRTVAGEDQTIVMLGEALVSCK